MNAFSLLVLKWTSIRHHRYLFLTAFFSKGIQNKYLYMQKLIVGLAVSLLIVACSSPNKVGESPAVSENIYPLIDSSTYQFVANQVQPQGGRTRFLNTLYFLRVTKEKLSVDLPYFGKAYSASIGSSGSPLRFESTDFTQSIQESKNDSRDILLEPKGGDVRQLFLKVYKNGTASLNVNSNSRQSISFSGYIQAIPSRK